MVGAVNQKVLTYRYYSNIVVKMRDITTIELKRDTQKRLSDIGHRGHSYDDVINQLLKDHEEIDKYIQRYIEGAKERCICKIILGRAVIANHSFVGRLCVKCGIPSPIVPFVVDNKTIISVGDDVDNISGAIGAAKEMLPDGGVIKLSAGEYNL